MTYTYVDTSALAKLVVREVETDALRAWIAASDTRLVTSDLTRTELARAVRRAAPGRLEAARTILGHLIVTAVTTELFEAAARLDPTLLRSLDAIHLACALDLGDDLSGVLTYDDRFAEATTAYGISVIAPS